MGWLNGWEYRRSHLINYASGAGTDYQIRIEVFYFSPQFYELSTKWTTIAGTGYHSFEPVHRTGRILEINKVIDGSTRKYLAYDCDVNGSLIRLYYTDDLDGAWTAYSGNPILGPSVNHYRVPSVIYDDGTFHMFLCDRTDYKIERWTSTDGINYSYQEDIVSLTYEWGGVPFIWYNTDDSKWYLSYTDKIATVPKTYLRSATNIVDLDSAESTLIYDGFALWSIIKRDGIYWGCSEKFTDVWTIKGHQSLSLSSGWRECDNSPILSNDEACPKLLSAPTGTSAYLFTNRDNANWYQDTREVETTFSSLSNNQIVIDQHCRTDFGDIRFTSSNGNTELDYWIQEKIDSNYAIIWVEIAADLSSENQTIYMYYGKADATYINLRTHGEDTFLFFDGEGWGGSVDWTTKWASTDHTPYSIENEWLKCTKPDVSTKFLRTQNNFAERVKIHTLMKLTSLTVYEHHVIYGDGTTDYSHDNAMIRCHPSYGSAADQTRLRYLDNLTAYITESFNFVSTTEHKVILGVYDNKIRSEVIQSGSQIGSQSADDAEYGYDRYLKMLYFEASGNYALHKWIFIRKFTDSEPVQGSWSVEQDTEWYAFADKIFIIDKEDNLYRIKPSDLSEEKTISLS